MDEQFYTWLKVAQVLLQSYVAHVFSLFDVNATYVYTHVKQIYITLFYVVDGDADQSFKLLAP